MIGPWLPISLGQDTYSTPSLVTMAAAAAAMSVVSQQVGQRVGPVKMQVILHIRRGLLPILLRILLSSSRSTKNVSSPSFSPSFSHSPRPGARPRLRQVVPDVPAMEKLNPMCPRGRHELARPRELLVMVVVVLRQQLLRLARLGLLLHTPALEDRHVG